MNNTYPPGPRRLTEEELDALLIDMKASSEIMRAKLAERKTLHQTSRDTVSDILRGPN